MQSPTLFYDDKNGLSLCRRLGCIYENVKMIFSAIFKAVDCIYKSMTSLSNPKKYLEDCNFAEVVHVVP